MTTKTSSSKDQPLSTPKNRKTLKNRRVFNSDLNVDLRTLTPIQEYEYANPLNDDLNCNDQMRIHD